MPPRKKQPAPGQALANGICEFVEFDGRDEGYCHASERGGSMNCEFADYAAKSYFPPCTKHWNKDIDESVNIADYNKNYRGK